jgi:hypothetical protein
MVELLSGRRKSDSGQLYSLKMLIAVSAVWGDKRAQTADEHRLLSLQIEPFQYVAKRDHHKIKAYEIEIEKEVDSAAPPTDHYPESSPALLCFSGCFAS